MKMPCGEFEIVKSNGFWVLRYIGGSVNLFTSLTRANVTEHYTHTYKPEENK